MRKKISGTVLVAMLALAIPLAMAGEDAPQPTTQPATAASPSKEDDIRALIRATGTTDMAMHMLDALLAQFRKNMPQVPEEFWTTFRNEVNAQELVDLNVPIYARHFTHEDVKELLAFYNSRVGKKLVRLQPQIMQESVAAGQKWGRKVAQRAIEKLRRQQEAQQPPAGGVEP